MMASLRAPFIAAIATALLAALFQWPAQADNRLSGNGHWSSQSHSTPHVTMVDRTGLHWPVYTSHLDWDVAGNIDVDYENIAGKTCEHHCVDVDAIAPSDDPLNLLDSDCEYANGGGFWGYAWYINGSGDLTSENHLYPNKPIIRLSTACNYRDEQFRRSLTCQEIGHALGLDHSGSTGSCMYQDPRYAATTPRGHDIDEMLDGRIYDHPY